MTNSPTRAQEPPRRPKIANRPQDQPKCFLDAHGLWEGLRPYPRCLGRLTKAHLIDQQELRRAKREFPELEIWDSRAWVWACGGITGAAGHHACFDKAKTLRLTRELIPWETEDFAEEFGLGWYLDRTYGER